jgi:uncharacterized protein
MRERALAVGLLLAIWLEIPLVAAFPRPSGYVNDFAGILDAETRLELESLLRDTEQKTTAEVVVATVASLDGMTVEQYGNELFRAWGIGQREKDNGVLVLVAPNDREMRIEVGYGLEPILPDGLAGEIIRTEFLPRFRDGDFRTGIGSGVRRVVAIVHRNQSLSTEERQRLLDRERASDQPPPYMVIPFLSLFVGFGFFSAGVGVRTRTFFPIVFGAMFGGMPMLMAVIPGSFTPLLVLGPLGLAMAAFGYRQGSKPYWVASLRGSKSRDGSDGWVMGASGSGGSRSSGSSGGGFGGGSSGGGGASGRW